MVSAIRQALAVAKRRGSPIEIIGVATKGNNVTTGTTISYASDFVAPGGGGVVPATGDFILVWAVHAGTANNTGIRSAISSNSTGAFSNTTALQQGVSDTNYCSSAPVHQFKGVSDTTINVGGVNAVPNTIGFIAIALRGVDTGSPLDVTPTEAAGASTGASNPPSITPVTAGALILALYGAAQGTGAAFTAAPSGMTKYFKNFEVLNGQDTAMAIAVKDDWISGAFDPGTCSGGTTAASDSWTGVTVALRPAP